MKIHFPCGAGGGVLQAKSQQITLTIEWVSVHIRLALMTVSEVQVTVYTQVLERNLQI